jgi:2-keto-4-pentenoate hydratase
MATFAALLAPQLANAAPPTPAALSAFADRVYDAWRAGTPMPQLTAEHPDATAADGYAVQQAFARRMASSERLGGYKAAGVGSTEQSEALTAPPFVGVIPATGVLYAKDSIVIDLSAYPNRKVETEIGFVFSQAMTAPVTNTEALKQLVSAVVPIVEVPGGEVDDSKPSTTADLLARNINAKTIILGSEMKPDTVDLDTVAISLTRDTDIINTARGGDAHNGQWATLLKTVNKIIELGHTIQPGHVITNGALGTINPAEPGDYQAAFGALGVITFVVSPTAP